VSGHGAQVIAFPARKRGGGRWEPWVPESIVARHYDVSTRTVRRWREAGMPSRMMGSSRRFRLSEIEAWHARGEVS
jgi:hypothetical protein